MASVKPTEQYRMVVVPHRPFKRFLRYFLLVVFFVLTVAASFFLGQWRAVDDYTNTLTEHRVYKQQLANTQVEFEQLQQQKANLALGSEVDRKANEELRAEIVKLKSQLASLEQDNNFYRELMSPKPTDRGIVIDIPSVESISAQQYKYNLVVKQIAAQHNTVSGYLEFVLVGTENNKPVKLALMDISETIKAKRLKLSFKYFQRFQGEITLPEGFEPQGIELKLVAQRPKSLVIDKKFGWAISEG